MADILYVDYAFSPPPLSNVQSVGYSGIIRYLSWLPNPKVITQTEYDTAVALGLGVRLVWEYNADDPKQGAPLGLQHSIEANRQADLLGYPADHPIYFAADYDCQPADWPAVEAYLTAAATKRPVGLYGPRGVIEAMLSSGSAKVAWQAGASTSWYGNAPDASGSNVSQVAHWYQRAVPTLPNPGGDIDENVQLRSDVADLTPTHPGKEFDNMIIALEGQDTYWIVGDHKIQLDQPSLEALAAAPVPIVHLTPFVYDQVVAALP